jgi:hypothetical protein
VGSGRADDDAGIVTAAAALVVVAGVVAVVALRRVEAILRRGGCSVIDVVGVNAAAGVVGCIASRIVGFGGSIASSGWTWIAVWTTTRIYVDLIHDTDYATPCIGTLPMTLEHIDVCLVVILLVGEVPSQVYLTVILIAKRHVTKSTKKRRVSVDCVTIGGKVTPLD